MTLTVKGQALSTVSAGHAVDVLNTVTKKILHGVARPDGTVENRHRDRRRLALRDPLMHTLKLLSTLALMAMLGGCATMDQLSRVARRQNSPPSPTPPPSPATLR